MRDGNPQIEDGYIKLSNELWEALMSSDFTKRERRVIDVIIRFSYGCGKKYADLTKSEIALFSDLKLPHVSEALKSLISKKAIMEDETSPNRFWFNKHYKDWEVSSGINENPQFSKRLKEVLKRNLTTPEGYQNGNQVTKTVSSGYQNGKFRLPKR